MHSRAEELQPLLQLDLYEAGWLGPVSFPGQSQRQVAMTSLATSLLKKFHNDEQSDDRDNKALALFKECNERCRNFGGVFPRRLNEELIINEMKSIVYDFFNPSDLNLGLTEDKYSLSRDPHLLNLDDIAIHFGLGNGSNIGASSTDFYTKYVNATMCHTDPILPLLFRQALSRDKLWSDVEVYRAKNFGFELVSGSRLSFVPKSRVISRTICTEPLLNMFFQKGIAGVMERRLREVFKIDLSNQPSRNSAMAHMGSVDNRFGTIDLSSASDSISLRMLEQILPPEPLAWLRRCRSTSTTLPGGAEEQLHMISSMGNGYTFPLQTMLFASLVTAAYRVYDIPIRYPNLRDAKSLGNFAVFGDDIIVDQRIYDALVGCLEILGFSVNRDKSFNEGLFRESCGSDFYSGYNVRGVYLKKLLSAGDFYSAINRLNYWSSVHGILLSRTVQHLRRGCRFSGVPYDEADDAGIKVPLSLLRTPNRDRNGAIKYYALVNRSRSVCIPSVDSDITVDHIDLARVRRSLPNFSYSSDGLLFCFLAGWIRNGSLGLRTLKPTAVLRRRVCPGWDERLVASGESLTFSDTWKRVTEANLVS